MALTKNISATVDVPSKFKEYRFVGYVTGEGKLYISFTPLVMPPPSQHWELAGCVEDIPDVAMTANQRSKVRALLRLAMEYWRGLAATGTPDADPDEPAP